MSTLPLAPGAMPPKLTRWRVLHGVGFPTIHSLALPGHAAFYRASPHALGVVRRGETWLREFYPYEFPQKPTFGPPTTLTPTPTPRYTRA